MNEEENRQLGEWIKAIAEGDKNAIVFVYHKIGKVMNAIAHLYTKQQADAEEIVEEALIAIVTKADRFRENNNAYAWIGRIVQNTAKNQMRKRRRISAHECSNDFAGLATEMDLGGVLLDEFLDSLSAKEKSMFVLCYWFGFSLAEAAKALRMPKSTLRYTLNKIEAKMENFYKSD